MKAYTITCHDVYNAGASLQAYALLTYLNNKGIETVIIDYKPEYLSRNFNLFYVSEKYNKNIILKNMYIMLKFPGRIINLLSKKKRKFDVFKKKYLKVTNCTYTSNEHLKKELPEFDCYIAGSDQIWNSYFKNGRDSAFYLDFAPKGKKKIAYAASMASKDIHKDYVDFVKEKISNIDYIGVREPSSLETLSAIGITNAESVVDPTFLLSKNHWDKLESGASFISSDKYLIVYDFDNNTKIRNFCESIAKEKNLKIYSFFKNNYADKVIDNYGPIEFLSIIKNSEFVISNSFHGTVFSIIYRKDFVVFDREENLNLRMHDLLKSLGLENRKSLSVDILNDKIDYDMVHELLAELIAKSKKFLNKCVGE